MEAKPAKLIEFFSGFKQSVIPIFQRPYVWSDPQWDIFWRDVLEQYGSNSDTNHFMGAIVTMPVKTVPVGVSKYLVIDGQQRLTTLVVLMCAIRDSLPPEAKLERARIQDYHITNHGYVDWEYLKLLPTELNGDRETFRDLVRDKAIPLESNLGQAHQYFLKCLAGIDEDDEQIDPKKVLETIEQRLMVVSINLDERDDPYLIFESLNAKGTILYQADLVRNYYLMQFPISDQQRVYDDLWLPMQNRLPDGNDLTEFMRQYLTLMLGEDVRKGEIYADLKRLLITNSPEVRDEKCRTALVETSLVEMSRFANHYRTLIHPEHETDPVARRLLSRLGRWEAETTHPLLMRLADHREHKRLSQSDYARALDAVESYIIRRSVCSVPTNQHRKIFIDLAAKVPAAGITEWLVQTLADGGAGRRWPTDEEFKRHWLSTPSYNYKQDRCKLMLEALEESFGHREASTVGTASIEHIMPQTLTEEWRAALGPEAEKVWLQLVHTIGNLTLTGYNTPLSNDSFAAKKKIYAESHYELNKYFAAVEKWDAAAIQARAEALWDRARKIWWRPESTT